MALNENDTTEHFTYHCYDCGGVWGRDGIDIISSKDATKYVCKECRGRCIPKDDVKKVIGVKSVKQRLRKRRVGIYVVIALVLFGFYLFYDRRVTVTDYKNYLVENATLRKSINSQLDNFRSDHIIIGNKKLSSSERNAAQSRINRVKRYILSKSGDVDLISKPDKDEIIELYNLETNFWHNPSYSNYLKYTTIFNELKLRYGNDLFEKLVSSVKKRLEKKNKEKLKNVKT